MAEQLDFPAVTRNSLDAVSDRDFALEFLSDASILMMHLSRFSEELIIWSTSSFRFIELSDGFCTGSSIMPQKKNPDVPELVRGKTGRVYGNLMALLTTMKSLPLAYNKDMQEDKEPLFDTIDTVKGSLKIFADMIREMRVNATTMRRAAGLGFSTATDVADYLVRKGLPFRDAHEAVGKAVGLLRRKTARISPNSPWTSGGFSPPGSTTTSSTALRSRPASMPAMYRRHGPAQRSKHEIQRAREGK